MQVKVKICGLTRTEDIQAAVEYGAQAVGFILYPPSKRSLTLEQAKALIEEVPVFISTVVLLVNPAEELVEQVITEIRPSYLQFHGDESVEFCESFHYPYIRAVRVGAPGLNDEQGLLNYVHQFASAKAFVFDAYHADFGGAGIRFDWRLLNLIREQIDVDKIIIAGGLNAYNVQGLKGQFHIVDLCSGVELSPGIKSATLIKEFMSALA